MRQWQYQRASGTPATLDEAALRDALVRGRLSVETPVRRVGSTRWRAAGMVRSFESALFPAQVLGPLPAFDAPDAAARPRASYPAPRPWVRFWARLVDLVLFTAVLAVAVAAVGWEPGPRGASFIAFATPLGWVVPEALLLTLLGTTPGKWLLRVRVRRRDGRPIRFDVALARSVDVWIRGLGLGLPLVMQVTELLAYGRLVRDGVTRWDRALDLEVHHAPIGGPRIALAAATVVLSAYVADAL